MSVTSKQTNAHPELIAWRHNIRWRTFTKVRRTVTRGLYLRTLRIDPELPGRGVVVCFLDVSAAVRWSPDSDHPQELVDICRKETHTFLVSLQKPNYGFWSGEQWCDPWCRVDKDLGDFWVGCCSGNSIIDSIRAQDLPTGHDLTPSPDPLMYFDFRNGTHRKWVQRRIKWKKLLKKTAECFCWKLWGTLTLWLKQQVFVPLFCRHTCTAFRSGRTVNAGFKKWQGNVLWTIMRTCVKHFSHLSHTSIKTRCNNIH